MRKGRPSWWILEVHRTEIAIVTSCPGVVRALLVARSIHVSQCPAFPFKLYRLEVHYDAANYDNLHYVAECTLHTARQLPSAADDSEEIHAVELDIQLARKCMTLGTR